MASTFRIERSTVIKAPPAKVFGLIDDFHQWALWSPWEAMETGGDLKKTYSGPDKGVGAHYAWEGSKTGSGQMDLTEADADKRVLIRLEFFKPMKAVNTADFELVPEGDGTKVTWSMYGTQSFLHRVMGSLFGMDKMVGGQFADGLARMKAVAEG